MREILFRGKRTDNYCYECNFWKYDKSIGCAHIGYCHAIPNDITTQDAFDKPCGLFKNRRAGKT